MWKFQVLIKKSQISRGDLEKIMCNFMVIFKKVCPKHIFFCNSPFLPSQYHHQKSSEKSESHTLVHNSEDFEQLLSIGPVGEAADGLVENVGQVFIKIKSERESEVFTHEGEYLQLP